MISEKASSQNLSSSMEVFAMPLEAIKSQTRRFASPRRFILLLASLVAASVLLISLYNFNFNSSQAESSLRLGVADKIYVISLPNRHKRREDMEKLRLSLQLHWVYVDALDANSPLVSQIMNWVRALRTGPPHILDEANLTSKLLPDSITFAWPEDIEILATSKDKLDLWSTGIWSSPITGFFKLTPYPPIACATKNYSLTKYTTMLKEHLVLTLPRVACWHSHLSVIHDIVDNDFGVSVILEDDVDMEQDIQKQLAFLWPTLPADWDILFLGMFSSHTGLENLIKYLSPRSLLVRRGR